MAVSTISTTIVTIPGSDKTYKKISFTNTADGTGAFATATITDAYGYIAKFIVSEGATGLNAAMSLSCLETTKVSGDHFFGSGAGIDFSSGNTSYIGIPGMLVAGLSTPIPVLLTGSYDIGTSTSQTTAAAIYTFELYLVDTI